MPLSVCTHTHKQKLARFPSHSDANNRTIYYSGRSFSLKNPIVVFHEPEDCGRRMDKRLINTHFLQLLYLQTWRTKCTSEIMIVMRESNECHTGCLLYAHAQLIKTNPPPPPRRNLPPDLLTCVSMQCRLKFRFETTSLLYCITIGNKFNADTKIYRYPLAALFHGIADVALLITCCKMNMSN